MLKKVWRPVDLVQGQDQLAVAFTREGIPVLLRADLAQAVVVVYLAIHNGVNEAIIAREGLPSAWGEVVDGEPAMAETDTLVVTYPEPRLVWAAVIEQFDGSLEFLQEGFI